MMSRPSVAVMMSPAEVPTMVAVVPRHIGRKVAVFGSHAVVPESEVARRRAGVRGGASRFRDEIPAIVISPKRQREDAEDFGSCLTVRLDGSKFCKAPATCSNHKLADAITARCSVRGLFRERS